MTKHIPYSRSLTINSRETKRVFIKKNRSARFLMTENVTAQFLSDAYVHTLNRILGNETFLFIFVAEWVSLRKQLAF